MRNFSNYALYFFNIQNYVEGYIMNSSHGFILKYGFIAAILAAVLAISCSTAPTGTTTSSIPPGSTKETGMMLAAISPSPTPAMGLSVSGQSSPQSTAGLPAASQNFNTEEYQRIVDNPFLEVIGNPLTTFSIDVDTASYANVRRFLLQEYRLPDPDAVRIEELINYFAYNYRPPTDGSPFAISYALAKAPWDASHLLLRVALRGRDVEAANLPPSNLVFLVDTSGSMDEPNKLPLVQQTLRMIVRNLRDKDSVAIVTYAGSAGLALAPTTGAHKSAILAAIDAMKAGGSTAGGEGIQLAYATAAEHFVPGGNNRIILATDGDFNVGVSSTASLERLIEDKRKSGICLSIFGYGLGNLKDSRLESLADKGNGSYAYIDSMLEANKVANKELWGTLATVAKDVKIQIEFNPAFVKSYRLIGYENRLLAKEDFANDLKDAGELGAGQSVTALYELVPSTAAAPEHSSAAQPSPPPAGPITSVAPSAAQPSPPLAFQQVTVVPSEDFMVFSLRYKAPTGPDTSTLITRTAKLHDIEGPMDQDFAFAASVAEFGMLLRDSPYKGSSSWDDLIARARASLSFDPEGYRAEFVRLAEVAQQLAER